MERTTSPVEVKHSLADDPRWRLVERIVASSAFVKSDRLCSFLIYICEQTLHGRVNEINETNTGARLFGRPDYDPSVDGIVRSHASRMRQKLEQYFSEDGAEEPIRLWIPKGAYIPVFEPRSSEMPTPQSVSHESASAEVDTTRTKTVARRPGTLRIVWLYGYWALRLHLPASRLVICWFVSTGMLHGRRPLPPRIHSGPAFSAPITLQ